MPIDVSTAALTGNISLPLPPLAIKVRCTAALLHRVFSTAVQWTSGSEIIYSAVVHTGSAVFLSRCHHPNTQCIAAGQLTPEKQPEVILCRRNWPCCRCRWSRPAASTCCRVAAASLPPMRPPRSRRPPPSPRWPPPLEKPHQFEMGAAEWNRLDLGDRRECRGVVGTHECRQVAAAL